MGSIKSFNSFDSSASINNATYSHYFTRLKMLCCAMYKWEGLPETIAKRFIENNLFEYGQLAFYKDDKYGIMVSKCTPSGMLNIYDEPIAYHCFGNNGYSKTIKANDCVIIRNNINSIPTTYLINLFCLRLYELERTIDVNLTQQKTPLIIQCEETQRLTLKNLLMKYDGNEPFIYGNKGLDLKGITVFKTDAPLVADKLFILKNEKWKECLDMLGINNANTSKKERLNLDEVNSNNQFLSFESDSMLMTREYACEEINEKFGLNISCALRKIKAEVQDIEGGEENE